MIKLDKAEFESLVLQAIKDLPSEFRKKLDNVDIIIEFEPDSRQLKSMRVRKGIILFGLYEGIPVTKRSNYTMVLPDKITIFQNSLESFCSTKEEIKVQVRKTVLHEIGHHFGMSEDELKNI